MFLQVSHATLTTFFDDDFKHFDFEQSNQRFFRMNYMIIFCIVLFLITFSPKLGQYSFGDSSANGITLLPSQAVASSGITKVELFFEYESDILNDSENSLNNAEENSDNHEISTLTSSSSTWDLCDKKAMLTRSLFVAQAQSVIGDDFLRIYTTCRQSTSTGYWVPTHEYYRYTSDDEKNNPRRKSSKKKMVEIQKINYLKTLADNIIEELYKRASHSFPIDQNAFGPWRHCPEIQPIAHVVREVQTIIDSKYGRKTVLISPQCFWNRGLGQWLPIVTYNRNDTDLEVTDEMYNQAQNEAEQMIADRMSTRFPSMASL